jgi:xanthine dehydrogenase accessory factor
MTELLGVLAEVEAAADRSEALALATVTAVQGSAFRRPGARLLIDREGPRVGSISGGCLEADVVEHARSVGASGSPRIVRYDLRGEDDLVFGLGVGCDGVVDILVEPLPVGRIPPWMRSVRQCLDRRRPVMLATALADDLRAGVRLADRRVLPVGTPPPFARGVTEVIEPPATILIFGAGEDARALAALAHGVGYLVTVVHPSTERASRERFPAARDIQHRHPGESIADLTIDDRTAAVLMTHRYEWDREWLGALAGREPGYLGVLGPRRRTERMRLQSDGWDAALHERLFSPVGLDIGAEGPEAIALSILAEIAAVFAHRAGGHLRDGKGRHNGDRAPGVLARGVIDADWLAAGERSCALSGG